MEHKKIKTKIPNGKLLELSLRHTDDKIIEEIIISGDFFMHPEEAIEELELFLISKKIDETLTGDINAFLDERGAEIVGFSTKDLVKSIIELSK